MSNEACLIDRHDAKIFNLKKSLNCSLESLNEMYTEGNMQLKFELYENR